MSNKSRKAQRGRPVPARPVPAKHHLWRRHRLLLLVVWWLWMPLGAFVIWLILRGLFAGVGTLSQSWSLAVVQADWLPGGSLAHTTPLFWIWVTIGLFGTAVILQRTRVVVVLAVLGGLFTFAVPFMRAAWDNDKDLARYYNASTVFHITSETDPPSSLSYLMAGARRSTGRCDYVGAADVPSCIDVGPMSGIASWTGRTSSLNSAVTMMDHAASPAPNVNVWDDTLQYLYGVGGGEWTAILDGSGAATPTYGIATWDGTTNSVHVGCRFGGSGDVFDRAFAGTRGNSLRNLIAEKYPDLRWQSYDVWGYCRGSRPMIVIPVERQIAVRSRSLLTAAGVVTVTGGPKGIVFGYRRSVAPGEFPGPVYASTVVDDQVAATKWAAGRKWMNRASFGYSVTTDAVQQGNVEDYLLRGPGGRLFWVTPLTPNKSTSQAFVAYAVSPADQVGDGRLNRLDMWVLPDGDPQIANLNTLTNTAANALRAVDATFLNTGGSLEEFTPLGGDMWRVYGVRNGLVQYYVDVSASGRAQPTTYNAGPGTPTATPPPSGGQQSVCGKPPAELTVQQLAACLANFAGELQRRESKNG